ncbi:MAG TPA: aminotransferase class V-fold PLP-dependent enzyme, partial [Spirochaetia bacterium]|nr:aminotransferase class V-fold PLP-dependent enzyme [Spirochaetia bacterium]
MVEGKIGRIGERSVESIRSEFPILASVSGKGKRPIAYLDNAATTQKPRAVIDAITHFYESTNANVHRALYSLGEEATAAYEGARRKVQGFINAEKPSEIIYTHGTTESINLVAYSWGRANIHEGDEILLSEMEHHSNLVPWQILAAERGATLKFIPFLSDGSLAVEQVDTLLSDRTRLVSVVQVSNVFGSINDVKAITKAAHERGIPVLVDGAQSVPHLPVDVQELDCDFLAFSGHKMCGPTGIGILYGKESLLEKMPPFLGGGEMIEAVWLDHATWNELPYKFEAGTPPIAQTVGLG